MTKNAILICLLVYFELADCYNNRYYSMPYIKKVNPLFRRIGFYDIYNTTNFSTNVTN